MHKYLIQEVFVYIILYIKTGLENRNRVKKRNWHTRIFNYIILRNDYYLRGKARMCIFVHISQSHTIFEYLQLLSHNYNFFALEKTLENFCICKKHPYSKEKIFIANCSVAEWNIGSTKVMLQNAFICELY